MTMCNISTELPMKIGALLRCKPGGSIREEFEKAKNLGLDCCQLNIWEPEFYTDENAAEIVKWSKETGVEVSAVWAGWSGDKAWDLRNGPLTIGLVPVEQRYKRLKELMDGGDFAQKIGCTDIITHVGFIPENPCHPDYIGTIGALKTLARYLKAKGLNFLFETGQETPITLVRAIQDIGTDNLGINFDTANLVINGKGNSLDAIDVFGQYVKNTHCKDCTFPTSGYERGHQVPLGEGVVNFKAIFHKLREIGYTGPWCIEREITGEQQVKDIGLAKDYILSLVK